MLYRVFLVFVNCTASIFNLGSDNGDCCSIFLQLAMRLTRTKFSGSPSVKPNPSTPVKRGLSAAKRVVMNCTVGEHKLLYSSGFKCLDKASDLQNLDQTTITGLRTIKGKSSLSIYRYTMSFCMCMIFFGVIFVFRKKLKCGFQTLPITFVQKRCKKSPIVIFFMDL
jgi:hypothetical protein